MKITKSLFRFDLVTLMPEMFQALTDFGVTGRAFKSGVIEMHVCNPREQHKKGLKSAKVVHMTPRGKSLDHQLVRELLKEDSLIIIASRYEGVDERINDWVDEEISVGDYVMSGGELPAMTLMDCMIRQLPGVLNDDESANQDSFVDGLLDHPHFTRPELYRGLKVPEVLMSGDHEKIRIWRLKESLRENWTKRPDLLAERLLTKEESRLLQEVKREQEQDPYN